MNRIIFTIIISITGSLLYLSCITTAKHDYARFIPQETGVPGWKLLEERYFQNNKDKDFPVFLKNSRNIVSVSEAEYVSYSNPPRDVNLTVAVFNNFLSSLNSYSEILLSTEKEIVFLGELSAVSGEKYVSIHENVLIIVETSIKDYSVIKEFQHAVVELLPETNKKVSIPDEVNLFGNKSNLLYLRKGFSHLSEIDNVFIRFRDNYKLLYKQYSSEEALLRTFANLSGSKMNYTLGKFQELTYLFKEDDKGKIALIFYYKDLLLCLIDVDSISNAQSIALRILTEAEN